MPLRVIYYDTETTGVKAEEDGIIEIAAYQPDTGQQFHSLVNPLRPIPKEVTTLTKITDDMVAEAPTFEVVGKQFIDFCGETAILIAHNNDKFDKIFLYSECTKWKLSLPSWRYIDTLKWARKYRPDLPSHALQALLSSYGLSFSGEAHRAMHDVMALYHLFSKMIDDLDMETVYALISHKVSLEKMPFGKFRGKPFSAVPKYYFQWLQSSGVLDKPEWVEIKEALVKGGWVKLI